MRKNSIIEFLTLVQRPLQQTQSLSPINNDLAENNNRQWGDNLRQLACFSFVALLTHQPIQKKFCSTYLLVLVRRVWVLSHRPTSLGHGHCQQCVMSTYKRHLSARRYFIIANKCIALKKHCVSKCQEKFSFQLWATLTSNI